jgi:DNA-directed RNA polymerase specialized sigma24 family protein
MGESGRAALKSSLNQETFTRLLDHLDVDRGRAGERYEDLRRTLVRFFEWRAAPFPEEHADETLDRVARKLAEGLEIANTGAYCYAVARHVYLETLKAKDARRESLEIHAETAAPDATGEARRKELRLGCLDGCLHGLPDDARALIIEYYRDDRRGRIEARRALATRLGVKSEALANRAQRLRDKLERCVTDCLQTKSTT